MKHIQTTIVSTYLNNRQYNKVTNIIPLTVHHSETTLPIGNPSYPGPTQNQQMSPTILIFKQNRRGQTPITIMPPLQIRTTHDNTLVQMHQHKHTTKVHGFVELGSLLVEWRWAPVSQRARIDGGYHRPVCVEMDAVPLWNHYRRRGGTNNNNMVCGMFVQCSLCVSLCMLTVSNALLISCATVIV